MMGIPGSAANPKVAVVAPPAAFAALDGARYGAEQVDLLARVISMGNCHRAFALTSAMCLAVAARIDGTVVSECDGSRGTATCASAIPPASCPSPPPSRARRTDRTRRSVTVYRTARRLMEGFVRVP